MAAGKEGGAGGLAVLALCFGIYATYQHEAADNGSFHRGGLQEVSRLACEVMHPVETMRTPNGTQTCERQHLLRQAGATCQIDSKQCDELTAYWGKSNHDYTDRRGEDSSFSKDDPSFVAFTDDNRQNLEAAYKAGTYGLDWTVMAVDYRSDSRVVFLPLKFDGVSNLLYGVSWFLNIPQKVLHQAIHVIGAGDPVLLLDILLAVALLPFQGAMAIMSAVGGLVVGSIMNPIDTVLAIPGGVILLVHTVFQAVWQLVTCIPHAWYAILSLAALALSKL